MIRIGVPFIEKHDGFSRLCADIDVGGGDVRRVWFQVDAAYERYLCTERSNAFLIGILRWAMKFDGAITCEAPVDADLLYQIRTYLIPGLFNQARRNRIKRVTVDAPVAEEPLPNAGGVGTGTSCGIDSFHVIVNQMNSVYPGLNLTHLVFNNVGSHGRLSPNVEKLRLAREENVIRCAEEIGLPLVSVNSNLAEVFPLKYIHVHTYSNVAAVYALQKLWGVFYYASSFGLETFTLKANDHACAFYDPFLLEMFSTRNLRFYCEGSTVSRFEKCAKVVDYPPAQHHLNVCIETGTNCGRCMKCERMLLTLDALGKLDAYSGVFDIPAYRKDRSRILWGQIKKLFKRDPYAIELFPYFRRELIARLGVVALAGAGAIALLIFLSRSVQCHACL